MATKTSGPKRAETRARFPLGSRVRMTERARDMGLNGRSGWPCYGTVAGYGHKSDGVRVLRDGTKQPETYHVDFWEPFHD